MSLEPFYHEGFVEVDGERLHLVCDFYAIDCIESVTGSNWDDIIPQLGSPSRSLAIKVLWGLLRNKHEGITLDQAAGVAFGKQQQEVGFVMFDVIRRACNMDDEPKAKGKNPPKRRGASEPS